MQLVAVESPAPDGLVLSVPVQSSAALDKRREHVPEVEFVAATAAASGGWESDQIDAVDVAGLAVDEGFESESPQHLPQVVNCLDVCMDKRPVRRNSNPVGSDAPAALQVIPRPIQRLHGK